MVVADLYRMTGKGFFTKVVLKGSDEVRCENCLGKEVSAEKTPRKTFGPMHFRLPWRNSKSAAVLRRGGRGRR